MSSVAAAPTLDNLLTWKDDFTLIDFDGQPFTVKWLYEPTAPCRRPAGISAWALHNGSSMRVHVCANSPCSAVHSASKYGHVPPPRHGRLPSPAVVGPAPAQPEPPHPAVVTAPDVPQPAAEVEIDQPSCLPAPDAPSQQAPVSPLHPASALPAGPCPGVLEQAAQWAVLGPAPVEPPPLPPPLVLIPPPKRAALPKGVAAAALPASEGQGFALESDKTVRHRDSESDTMVMVETPDDVLVVGELYNPILRGQLQLFICDIESESAYTGISMFLLMALMKRIKVFVWCGLQRRDILREFAPWALDAISAEAQFEAIGCTCRVDSETGDRTLHVAEESDLINHWVACINSHSSHGDGGLEASDSIGHGTQLFAATYLSLSRVVIETIADGNCGIDVMCFMLGLPRQTEVRRGLRWDIGAFVLEHLGNRALIAALWTLGEIGEHVGLFELKAAGANLLSDVPRHGGGSSSSHIDGSAGAGPEPARVFTDEEVSALKWKCRLQKASPEAVLGVLRALPAWVIEETTLAFQQRPSPEQIKTDNLKRVEQADAILLCRDQPQRHKRAAAKAFLDYCETREGGLKASHRVRLMAGRIPYGWFADFARGQPKLRYMFNRSLQVDYKLQRKSTKALVSKTHQIKYMGIMRMYKAAVKDYLQNPPAVAEEEASAASEKVPEVLWTDRFKYHTPRQGQQYMSGQRKDLQQWKRRRAPGAGRRRSAVVVRDSLLEWYSNIRHSVDCKLMMRFPKQALLVKAQMLHQDYLVACLRNSVNPEAIDISKTWLRDWLIENRITHRRPNRKYKVARWVLAERLEIFWLSVMKIRKLILLHFGYEPECSNVDQSPFHMNEAGSAACNTLSLKGAVKVPLLENHAATRERWSLNSITRSSEDQVRQRLPGFELMFKAQGQQVKLALQEYVFAKGLPFKVTVVTGDSGSYKEEDILAFLESHLRPWDSNRRWELFFLDAYAPGLTDNVQRLCWSKGYIEITHGGGASSVCQTNDTDHHQWVRKRFIEIQSERLIQKGRSRGGGLVDLTRQENIDIMIEVMSSRSLHLKACLGYKYTGTTVSLDGKEDAMICREAKDFWMERGMRRKIDAAVADVEAKYHAGDLPWNWATVRSLIGSYPARRQLDVIKAGWEDEATPDPDGVPWDPRRARTEGDDESPLEEDECQSDASDAAECDVGPEEEPGDVMQSDIVHHGHGDDQEANGGVLAKQATSETDLSAEQAESLLRHSGRLQSLQKAKDIFHNMGGSLGASLRNTVSIVMGAETKKFRERMRGDAAVAAELRSSLDAEEEMEQRQRAEFQAQMQRVREKKQMDRELREVQDRLRKSRQSMREAQAVVAAKEHIKSYSLAALGEGKKNGGGPQFQKARHAVLERVRAIAPLSPAQRNDWDYFKAAWDQGMAEAHGENWAGLFAEMIQNLLDELRGGKDTALSDFMHSETLRVLGHVPSLVLPGC